MDGVDGIVDLYTTLINLNPEGSIYIVGKDSCQCSTSSKCDLVDSILNDDSFHKTIIFNPSITLRGTECLKFSILTEGYVIKKGNGESITFGSESVEFGGFEASRSLTITEVNLFVGKDKKKRIIKINNGLVFISGSDSSMVFNWNWWLY